jgi:hypothetical protein
MPIYELFETIGVSAASWYPGMNFCKKSTNIIFFIKNS